MRPLYINTLKLA